MKNIKHEIEVLKSFSNNENKPLSNKIYHAISFENFFKTLEQNDSILPRTFQRFWKDGLRRKDTDADYESSYWMQGFSFTRNKEFAFSWNDIVLEFDRDELSKSFEIIPFSWNFSMSHRVKNINHKKELEEFVRTKGFLLPFKDPLILEEELLDLMDLLDSLHYQKTDEKSLSPYQIKIEEKIKEIDDNHQNKLKFLKKIPLSTNGINLIKYCKKIHIAYDNIEMIEKIKLTDIYKSIMTNKPLNKSKKKRKHKI